MTETEKKALALVNEVRDERGFRLNVEMQREDMAQEALCRAIEQHEAFRQEVSDAVEEYFGPKHLDVILAGHRLSRFIIAKPDPLVEAWNDMFPRGDCGNCVDVEMLRAALAARGLEVRKIGESE